MLRVFIRGVIEQSSRVTTLSESIEILRVLSPAAPAPIGVAAASLTHPFGCTVGCP